MESNVGAHVDRNKLPEEEKALQRWLFILGFEGLLEVQQEEKKGLRMKKYLSHLILVQGQCGKEVSSFILITKF